VQSLQKGFAELVEAKLSPSAIEKLAKLVINIKLFKKLATLVITIKLLKRFQN
jgi:hypothetical protein